jgi:TRAP transporter TAXI family solute receptor
MSAAEPAEASSSPRQRREQQRSYSFVILFVGLFVFAAIAAALYFALRPETLRIAVGPPGSDDQKLVQLLAQTFARQHNSIRLAPISTEGAVESVALLAASKTDLAVARGDQEMPADAQSVAIVRKNVVVLWAPTGLPVKGSKKSPTPKIKSLDDLQGHRVAVIGKSQANVTLLRVILNESGISPDKVTVVQFATTQIGEMARDSTIDAFMAVGPLDSKITADAITATARERGEPKFLPIDVSEAIAQRHPLYESEEIPGSTFSSAPARPEDKIETVSVDHLIVAHRSLSESAVGEFTRQLFADRQSLIRQLPAAANIATPNTDKAAALPAHRGAAAYIDGTERTFLEKYSDYMWAGILLLSGLGSAGAWFRSYLKRDEKVESITLRDRTLALIVKARQGNSVAELQDMQHEVDGILREVLVCYDDGAIDEGDLAAFNLVFEQFHHAITDRRVALEDMPQDLTRPRPTIAKT